MSIFSTDLLRVLAGTFIIFNHTSWNYFVQIGSGRETFISHLSGLINQLGKPSVLFFIFLSGLAFSSHKLFSKNFHTKTFYKNRLLRILPPYLLVSFLGIVTSKKESENILFKLITGEAMFHLYFIPLILICYAFFPLFRKIPFNKKNLFLAIFFLIVPHLFVCYQTGYPFFFSFTISPENTSALASANARWWLLHLEYLCFGLPVFLFGVWWGKQKKAYPLARIMILGLILSGTIIVLIDFYTKVYISRVPTDPAGRIWRISVLMAAILWIISFSSFQKSQSLLWLRSAARASFLVYLIHPFFINIFYGLPYFFYIPVVILFSWATALILQSLALKYNAAGFLLGEGDRLWARAK